MERIRHQHRSDTHAQHIRHSRLHFGHETKQEHGHTSSFATLDDVLHIIRQEHPEQTLCSFRDTYVLQSTISYFFSLFLCLLFDCVEEGTSGGVNQGVKMGMGDQVWMWHST